MNPEVWVMAGMALMACVGWGLQLRDARREREKAAEFEADANYYRSLLGWLRGAPVLGRPAFPENDETRNLPVGTPANPIITANGDSARWGTLEDLTR